MQVHYLEIITPDVDGTCGALEKLHGVSFSAPEAGLGKVRGNEIAMMLQEPMTSLDPV